MLISVHLPKTAGSSFLYALDDHFKSSLKRDYGDFPINTPKFSRNISALSNCVKHFFSPPDNSIQCIHGHFLPLKYASLNNALFVTWLRNPIERLASHYYYWKRNYNPDNAPALHKRMMDEEWSLEHFCLSQQMKNFYCQFLWGFPLTRFNFIGITEQYEKELDYLSKKILNVELSALKENVNDNKPDTYFENSRLRTRIELFHDKDMQLYLNALKISRDRK